MTLLRSWTEPPGDVDCCVIGAGPVGLAFAMAAAEAGLTVLLVDAGTERSAARDIRPHSGQRTEILDPARHAPLQQTVRRGVGGTSSIWGGRCVPFEPIDFEERDYVPDSAWPIDARDVEPYVETAARFLDCGASVFRSDQPDWNGLGDIHMSNLERWARQPKFATRLGRRVIDHPNVTALLDTRLVDADFAADGKVARLVVERAGTQMRLRARSYVLALGGLETTRFLLEQQRRRPDSFGGPDGPLGRYYMGHLTGSIADIVLDDPARAADLDFVLDEHDTYVRRRFSFSEEAQRKHRVLNTAFYLDNPPFYEHEHRNPTLSLVFLGLILRPIGRRILAEGIRLRHIGRPPYRISAHLRNVLRKPWRAVGDVLDILRRRYLSSVRKPGFILRNDRGRYGLHYHAEQLPFADSRLTMATAPDGTPVLRVDYRYQEEDIDSLLRCHQLLDERLRESGIGRLEYLAADPAGVRESAWEQTTDGFHSIGTTRMGFDPTDGVVDRDCRTFWSSNLFIASSSVFRTAGEANPTFLAACLGVRLANHLSGVSRRSTDETCPGDAHEQQTNAVRS
ncbi:GMC oxidoreductase [Agromyces larvae]|uniref:GMC oxidoreductase n=1 Tax=Agromyces larvae TaxID=2929802 RepID=A0ABY4BU61_9MICO|nr:GMC oxidoreductase [Agromyces larvae]UOE42747.1 GMC oxidoreductase [Agromyces larvae]